MLLCACFAAPCGAQQAVRVHMHLDEGYAADGMLYAAATGEPPFAPIILVPDDRGLDARAGAAAADLARQGFAVLAVDLNRGMPPDTAGHSAAQAQHDLNAALAFIEAQANLKQHRIGLLAVGSGVCSAFALAGDPRVAAIAIETSQSTRCVSAAPASKPVLASFTGAASPDAGLLRGASASTPMYAHAEAGFDDPEDSHYAAAAAAEEHRREQQFFKRELR